MRLMILLIILFNLAHAMQCEFDAIEVIEYVSENKAVPPMPDIEDAMTFKRAASDFPDYLVDGVRREQNTYKSIYQRVVNGQVSTDKFEAFQRHLTDQVGRDGYLRVMSPDEIATIQRQGGINPSTRGEVFFSQPSTGAHMGHGGNITVVKCPTEKCAQYFSSSSTGSGTSPDIEIPIEDLEFIIPDVEAAARAAGIVQ